MVEGVKLMSNKTLAERVNEILDVLMEMSQGDYSVQIELSDKNDDLDALASGINMMIDDINQQREELLKAFDTTNTLLEQIPVGMIVVGKDKKIRRVNPAALKMFGAESDGELFGQICHKYICPAEIDKCPVLDLGNRVEHSERVLLTKDGKKIPILKTVRVINFGGEEVLLETFEDITEHKKAEEEREKLQKQLMQSEKMASVGQLAGGVAHEINNPMGVILGFAQSIAKRVKEEDPLYMPLKSIEREAIRCKKLVGDLLTFSRTAKTGAEMSDINMTIEGALSLIEAQTKVKNVKISKKYGDALPQIMLNKNQIQQVIINLCNNAIDVMPDGGKLTITTSIDTGSQMLDAGKSKDSTSIKDQASSIKITITDTGKGMGEEVKKHLFEPFFTTKEVGKGTGLGLSLCYETIQKHKGTIEVISEVGKGTTFIIRLPINFNQ